MARGVLVDGFAAPKVTNVGSSNAATSKDANGRTIYYTDGAWYYGDGTQSSGPGTDSPTSPREPATTDPPAVAAPKVTNVGSSNAATSKDANGRTIYYTDGAWYYGDGTSASGPGSAPPNTSGTDTGGNTGSNTGGDKGGGGGENKAPDNPPPTDWSIFLGTFAGMDQSLIDQLNDIWKNAGADASVATPLIMNAVMGSKWFGTNYPGYFEGVNHGLYGDIRGYVSYENDVNTLYQQYFGRVATGTEISNYLSKGLTASYVSSQLQSSAMQGTLSDPIKALFTADELKAYTDERSGIDSALGQKILGEVNTFSQVNPLFQSFYERSVTRDELNNLTKNGTDPSQVSQQFKASGYLDSVPQYLKSLFSQDELQQMATDASGGDTQHGKQLLDMANLATSLNQVYQIHYGASLTRDELNLAYSQGYTAQHVDSMLSSGEYANALPQNVKDLFTPDELKQAGEQAAGLTSSDQGQRILNIVKGAGDYASMAHQYGAALTGEQVKNFYDTGLTANNYGNQLAGSAWAKANEGDIQQASGSFGSGLLTPEQLSSLGSEKAGYDTPQGQQIASAYNKAVQRMNGVFQGVLAKSGGLSKSLAADTSDVAA